MLKKLLAVFLTSPRAGAALFQKEGDRQLYLYEERGGYNNIRQDWWRPVRLLPKDKIEHLGAWQKHNVGYPPGPPECTKPFTRLTEAQVSSLLTNALS